ncbi:hypothetical protein [Cryptosporangium arvum]|uniref:Uncharacterized protein n=1 Tax=Cryptosporangium arvum DSM 44712 TaxID=927661 RepID=A0A011ACT8_9ACTN|nr:hypothetical protein [Cryptosporangium arvum]EXG79861.1 hypothetical protein CryarDRAFT_0911 [Cryptosporangium arvum DSM 44712]
MNSREILIAFTGGGSVPLGNVWRITAKKTDFYIDPLGDAGLAHLSVHGPNEDNPGAHRFHIKVDRRAAAEAQSRGDFVAHSVFRKGHPYDGQRVAPGAYRVARIRWTWDLQRPRYRNAAPVTHPLPEITPNRFGARLSKELEPNQAADVDLVVSYGEPHWPEGPGSLRDNARLGPLENEAGMFLTATSFRRSQMVRPAPTGLVPRLPRPGEEPARLLCAGPGDDGAMDMYWFVEAITSRELLEASREEIETS